MPSRRRHTETTVATLASLRTKSGRCSAGPVDEKAYRVGLSGLGYVVLGAVGGKAQRWDPVDALALDRERLSARGEDAHPGTRAQQLVGELGAGVDEVLAVVQHDEQVPVLQGVDQRLSKGSASLLAHPERRRHLSRHEIGVSQGGEVDEPHPAPGAVNQLRGRPAAPDGSSQHRPRRSR